MKLYKLPGETQSDGSFSGHNSSVAETHFVEDAYTNDFTATLSVETIPQQHLELQQHLEKFFIKMFFKQDF